MGYIILDRKILEWEWYSDKKVSRLFIHMLLRANWKAGKFHGMDVERGSFVSSVNKLSSETGLTEQEIKTAISKLKTTGEITSKSTNKFTVYIINNYDLYQINNQQINEQITDNQQTINNQITNNQQSNNNQSTTIEEYNKGIKKESNKRNNKRTVFTPPTIQEVRDYCSERKNKIDAECFVDFYKANGWVQGKGKPIKDWKAAIRLWERNGTKRTNGNLGTDGSKSKNVFNNFTQNNYDFKALENELFEN